MNGERQRNKYIYDPKDNFQFNGDQLLESVPVGDENNNGGIIKTSLSTPLNGTTIAYGNMFDLLPVSSASLSLTQLSIHTEANNTKITYGVYSLMGSSYRDCLTDIKCWGDPVLTGRVMGRGAGKETLLKPFKTPLELDHRGRGFYVTLTTNELRYSTGMATQPVWVEDEYLQVMQGVGIPTFPLRGGAFINSRPWNGVVYYTAISNFPVIPLPQRPLPSEDDNDVIIPHPLPPTVSPVMTDLSRPVTPPEIPVANSPLNADLARPVTPPEQPQPLPQKPPPSSSPGLLSLETTFYGDTLSYGNMFDLIALQSPLTIRQFSIHTESAGIVLSYQLYVISDSYKTCYKDLHCWGQPLSQGTVVGAGPGLKTPLPPFEIPMKEGERRGFYLTLTTNDLRYSMGTQTGGVLVEDEYLRVEEGAGIPMYPLASVLLEPRPWNGVVFYKMGIGGAGNGLATAHVVPPTPASGGSMTSTMMTPPPVISSVSPPMGDTVTSSSSQTPPTVPLPLNPPVTSQLSQTTPGGHTPHNAANSPPAPPPVTSQLSQTTPGGHTPLNTANSPPAPPQMAPVKEVVKLMTLLPTMPRPPTSSPITQSPTPLPPITTTVVVPFIKSQPTSSRLNDILDSLSLEIQSATTSLIQTHINPALNELIVENDLSIQGVTCQRANLHEKSCPKVDINVVKCSLKCGLTVAFNGNDITSADVRQSFYVSIVEDIVDAIGGQMIPIEVQGGVRLVLNGVDDAWNEEEEKGIVEQTVKAFLGKVMKTVMPPIYIASVEVLGVIQEDVMLSKKKKRYHANNKPILSYSKQTMEYDGLIVDVFCDGVYYIPYDFNFQNSLQFMFDNHADLFLERLKKQQSSDLFDGVTDLSVSRIPDNAVYESVKESVITQQETMVNETIVEPKGDNEMVKWHDVLPLGVWIVVIIVGALLVGVTIWKCCRCRKKNGGKTKSKKRKSSRKSERMSSKDYVKRQSSSHVSTASTANLTERGSQQMMEVDSIYGMERRSMNRMM